MARPQARMHVAYAVLIAGIVSALPVGCSDETLPIREVPPRGTVGQELFSIVCNRMGAQALREDLTGASFAAACTRDSSGRYAKDVDRSRLPPLEASARNEDGDLVPLDVQQKTRDHGIARLSALIRRRDAFIQAVDQIIPDVLVPSKNIESEDPQKSCEARRDNSGRRSLSEELRVMLGKTASLYDEGTLPRVTRSTAKLLDTFKASPDAQKSVEQFNARQGYRPSLQSLGLFRSLATYPRLRELADATLSAVSPDSNPYDLRPEFDELGNRKWTPGKAHAEFGRLLTVLHQEMRTARVSEGMPSLTTKSNPNLSLESLSRPRTNLELLQHVMFFENETFQSGSPQFLVRRDPRGVAAINLGGGVLPSPLQDSNKDGLADLDDSGQFLLDRGAQLLTPFTTKGALRGPGRDSFDRALRSDGSTTFYNYLDTRRTFMARALQELRSMVDSNPAHRHETLMYLLAGGKVVLGNRVPASKCFGLARDINGPCGATPKSDDVEIRFDAFDSSTSPLIDLVHATAQVMGDPNADDTLNLLQHLFEKNTSDVARLVGEALKFKALADEDSRATLKPGNILWDELLEWASELVEVPGLLEDTLSALASDDSSNLGKRLASMMRNRDAISYTRGNINGGPYNLSTKRGSFSAQGLEVSVDRNAPASGTNRSVFQRFLGLVNDASGVTLCNKQGSVLHARGVPLPAIANNLCPQNTNMDVPGTFRCVIIQKETHPGRTSLNECEVFKVDDIASFYIGAISGRYDRGKGQLYLRDKVARDGITVLGITAGAATVDVMEKSSGFEGFWAPGKTADADGIFYPQPRWLNRMVSFDQATDNSAPTKAFLADLVGPHIGSAVCKEREIRDPLDGSTVRRLRSCADGEYLDQRSKDTFLAMEVPMTHSLNGKTSTTTVYEDLRPLLMPFVVRNREDLFVKLTKILHKHWANDDATASECKLSPTTSCARTGGVLYEPLLDQFLGGEPMAAGYSLLQKLRTINVQHCAAVDAVGQCTKTVELPALQVVANLLRPLLSKAGAETNGIASRNGETRARWSDGSLQGRVTPLRLLLDALTSFDRSFEAYAVKEPADKGRLEQWRLARSQLVDQFLTVDTAGGVSKFQNSIVVPMGQRLLGTLRSQLRARCPNTYWGTTSDKRSPCLWVTSEWRSKVETLLANPILSAGFDLLEQLRRDDGARIELERLVEYLSGTNDEDDKSAALLVSGSDMLQLLGDETRLVPFLRSISEVTAGTTGGTASGGPATSAIDSLLSLLSRVSKRAYDAEGREQCHREIDPNQILVRLLRNAFTSSGDENSATETPIEVLADTLAEVNRAVPADTGRLRAFDYASIADNMAEFLLDDERGLEQLYAIMRQGTAPH